MEPAPPPPAPGAVRSWKSWQALILLTPAVELWVVAAFSGPFERILFPGTKGYFGGLTLLAYNIPFDAALCCTLAVWWTRDCREWGQRVVKSLLVSMLLIVVNAAVAFAGCAAAVKAGW